MHGWGLVHFKGEHMPKAKRKLNGNSAAERLFEVVMSFELRKPDKKLLPACREGILVKGETVPEGWFFPDTLERHLEKGYLKYLPKVKKKNGKAKAAH